MAFDVIYIFSSSSPFFFHTQTHSRVRVSMKAIVSCFFYIYLKDAQRQKVEEKKKKENLTHDRYSAVGHCATSEQIWTRRSREKKNSGGRSVHSVTVCLWMTCRLTFLYLRCDLLALSLSFSCFSGETSVGSCLKRAQVTFICCQVNKLRQRRRVRKTKGFNKVCDSCLVNCFTKVLNQLGSEPFFICLTCESLDYFT